MRLHETVPLIAHIVFRFDYGGLENGIVNLVNRMASDRYRHVIVCLSGYGEDFRRRLRPTGVQVVSIEKKPGKDISAYGRMWQLSRRLRPAVFHTRNVGTVDLQWVAAAAGVPHRVHGEHGWSPSDPQGSNRRNLMIRRACRPVIHRYVAMSSDIENWLAGRVHVPRNRIQQIYNGVDTERFRPAGPVPEDLPWSHGAGPDGGQAIVIGTVGRLDPIKNHATLLADFARLLNGGRDLRLIIAGDGPERAKLLTSARDLGILDRVWFAGAREDVPDIMRAMDVFVLPSINEGISNTLLEAMASGLPVVAGDVGGNPELVVNGTTGILYNVGDVSGLHDGVLRYLDASRLRQAHGAAGRARVMEVFSLDSMIDGYLRLYDDLVHRNPSRMHREAS